MHLLTIVDKVYSNIIENNMIASGDSVLVGLSGGADSVMLLTVLINLKSRIGFSISAAHVNHGIRGADAQNDQDFCRNLCKSYDVPYYTVNFDIPTFAKTQKISEENAGRIKRYEYFNSLCNEKGFNKIAVAHNMNDSVETVIINLIRGCSLNGLCGIRPVNDNIIRPIFNISRDEIEAYLEENKICYCTDMTNFSNAYTRNRVRNEILKSMSEINPSVAKTIFTNLKAINDENDYINNECERIGCVYEYKNDIVIDKTVFTNQHPAIKRRLIYEAFRKLIGDCKDIEGKHADILLGQLKSGSSYDMPRGVTVDIAFDKIIFTKSQKSYTNFLYKISPGDELTFSDGTICRFELVDKADFGVYNTLYVDYEKFSNKDLTIRSRKEGDKISLYGMNGTKKLKQLFSELKIPLSQRNNVPLLCDGDIIAAVVPYRINDKYKVTDNTKTILRIHMIKEI